MTWIAVAIGGGQLLGAAASVKAAKTQAAAARDATAAQERMFERQVELQEPWRQAGINALARLEKYPTFGMDQFQTDPGYAFRFDQGQKALERSAAARGGLISGGTGGALQQFGQGLASQEYQNAFNRYQAERANLAQLAGFGQSATNQQTAAAGQYGANVGNLMTGAGAAQAAGYVGAANALAGGVSQYMNYQSGQNLLNALRAPAASAPAGYMPTTNYSFAPDYSFGGGRL